MNDLPIAWVLFDLGGVLIEFAGFERLPDLLDEPLDSEEVRRRWIASPAVAAFECGGLDANGFAAALAREWKLRVAPEVFIEQFADWALDFYPGARELVAEAGRQVSTACFSNSNPLHWEKNFRRYRIQDAFDRCFASFELGYVKPQARAFELVVECLGCCAEQVLFLDDTDVNVVAARQVGLCAERVRGVAEARAALAARGLVVSG